MLPTCNSFFKVLSSTSSEPAKRFTFTAELLNELDFSEGWEVALCDIQLQKNKKIMFEANLWVCSDLIEGYQVGNVALPLLRRISTANLKNTVYLTFQDKQYMAVCKQPIRAILITIKGAKERLPNNTSGEQAAREDVLPTSLTLHFRKLANGDASPLHTFY